MPSEHTERFTNAIELYLEANREIRGWYFASIRLLLELKETEGKLREPALIKKKMSI